MERVCNTNKGNYENGRENEYISNWDTNGNFKVIEGQVFEFGGKERGEVLAFEKMGEGQDIFGTEREGSGGTNRVTAGDWLKLARWEGNLGDQSCNSVEQWETRDHKGANSGTNQCTKNEVQKEGDNSGKWLNDQSWDNIQKRFGLKKKSKNDNCQWLMKEPFKGSGHEDLRPEHTMVMDFGLVLSLITNNEICR
ncbi:hypothetical protein MSU_0695 [Mycoplasma suis str. Illinois]|uniref:Uncharacterized protein n=2 Tax=Mycoplasma suis TaxID=57372 RepID=F0QRV6_MYCSL|nr:hypothetical protein MSU_0695 [Mycoplasma suis str. Illinois]